jgi:energy-coupling factor transporter transmembrane protein EcfT
MAHEVDNHGSPAARSAFARISFGAGFTVKTLWRVAPTVLVLWLLGFVTLAMGVGDGRG